MQLNVVLIMVQSCEKGDFHCRFEIPTHRTVILSVTTTLKLNQERVIKGKHSQETKMRR